MTKEGVIRVILDERDYQDHEIAGERADMFVLDMGSALSAIQHNVNKALEVWYKDDPLEGAYQNTLEYLRKVAALIVNQGEIHGMPRRKWAGSVDNMKVKSEDGMSEKACPSSLHDQCLNDEVKKEDLEVADVYLAREVAEVLKRAIRENGLSEEAEYKVDFDGEDKILVNIVVPPVCPENIDVEVNEPLQMKRGAFMYQDEIPWIDISSEKNREYTLPNGCLVAIKNPMYFFDDGEGKHKIYTSDHKCYFVDTINSVKVEWDVKEDED